MTLCEELAAAARAFFIKVRGLKLEANWRTGTAPVVILTRTHLMLLGGHIEEPVLLQRRLRRFYL
jgi:hypothetical protein